MVKQVASFGGDISDFVPACLYDKIKRPSKDTISKLLICVVASFNKSIRSLIEKLGCLFGDEKIIEKYSNFSLDREYRYGKIKVSSFCYKENIE